MPNRRYALIMAGGRGTRFWPRSRKRSAKQVLRFFGERSLIQQTADRLAGVIAPDHLITKEARFRKFVKAAFKAAETSDVVVLGIQPRWAETGYGYIEFPKGVTPGSLEASPVTSFREKPDEK